jgi:hypothetical protein
VALDVSLSLCRRLCAEPAVGSPIAPFNLLRFALFAMLKWNRISVANLSPCWIHLQLDFEVWFLKILLHFQKIEVANPLFALIFLLLTLSTNKGEQIRKFYSDKIASWIYRYKNELGLFYGQKTY